MKPIRLTLLRDEFSIHRLPADAQVPAAVFDCPFYSVSRTADEVSIVVPETVKLESTRNEPGWACLKVMGPLDFGLTGILAGISRVLAEEGISIFAISTFDTDYILMKKEARDRVVKALETAGYQFLPDDD